MSWRTVTRHFSQHVGSGKNPWLEPQTYALNRMLRLFRPESNTFVDAKIVKAFQPFTNSVTLLVDTGSNSSNLPREVVLKLADRRFGYRFKEIPWTEDGEHKFQMELDKYYETHGSHVGLEESTSELIDNELLRWNDLNEYHQKEAAAYTHLTEAQNLGLVPKFYGQTCIHMSESSPAQCHPALATIHGILLEYIPGRVMDSVRVGVDISVEQAEAISQRVIALGRRLRRYGVTHSDIHLGNIILRFPGDDPVLIDWGFASVDNVTLPIEERWDCSGARMDFQKDIRFVLTREDEGYENFWHRASTPLSNEVRERFAQEKGGDANAWRDVNKSIRRLPAHELELFYFEDERICEDQGLRWKVKDGVKTRDGDDAVPSNDIE